MPDNPFCFEGHQLPELFLLGVQKCGTTSLTKQLFTEWGFFGDAQAKGLCTAENRRYASKNGHDCAGTHDDYPYGVEGEEGQGPQRRGVSLDAADGGRSRRRDPLVVRQA